MCPFWTALLPSLLWDASHMSFVCGNDNQLITTETNGRLPVLFEPFQMLSALLGCRLFRYNWLESDPRRLPYQSHLSALAFPESCGPQKRICFTSAVTSIYKTDWLHFLLPSQSDHDPSLCLCGVFFVLRVVMRPSVSGSRVLRDYSVKIRDLMVGGG